MKILFLALGFLFYSKTYSQNSYRISYDFISNGNEIKTQAHALLANSSNSYFFKENLLDYKIELRKTTIYKKDGQIVNTQKDTSYISSIADSVEREKAAKYKKIIGQGTTVTKDFVNSKLFFTAWSIYFKDTSTVKDTLNTFEWKLINDTIKTVSNEKCKMAKLNWRGRDYIAWYAPTIAIFDGPYKFCGLPGLIMEIYDTENIYKYICTRILKEDGDYNITKPDSFILFEEYKAKLKKGILKLQELLNAKTSINSECTTCGSNTKSNFNLTAGIELSLYEGL